MIYLALFCAALSAWPWLDSSSLIADYLGQAALHQCAAYILLALISTVLKRRKSGLLFLLIAAVNLALVGQAFTPPALTGVVLAKTDIPKLRILSFNFWRENKEIPLAFDTIHAVDADIVWIPEVLRKPYWQMMQEFETEYPYRYPETLEESAQEGSVLMSKYPFTLHFDLQKIDGIENRITHATLNIQGKRVDVIGLHVLSPRTDAHLLIHNQQLAVTGNYILATAKIPAGTPLIIAGDMNSGIWRPTFSDFMHSVGVSPTSSLTSLPLTWPSWLPWPLQIPIDQILISPNFCHTPLKRAAYSGSDHYPVYTDLSGC